MLIFILVMLVWKYYILVYIIVGSNFKVFDWCVCIFFIDVKKVFLVKGICNGFGKEVENIF